MENQHRKIVGYRELTQDEIDLMNQIKEKGKELGTLVEALWDCEGIDRNWLMRGEEKLQIGLMCLTRSVAKPDFF